MSYENKGTLTATVTVSREPDRSGNYICDGIADNVQIQAAIDYVVSLGGGLVHFGRGQYDIAATVILDSDVVYEGSGWDTVLRLANATNLDIFSATSKSNMVIRDLKIDGNKANQTPAAWPQNGVYFDTCSDSQIVNVFIENAGMNGVTCVTSTNILINRFKISDWYWYGIMVEDSHYIKIIDGEINGGVNYDSIALVGTAVETPTTKTVIMDVVMTDAPTESLHLYRNCHDSIIVGCTSIDPVIAHYMWGHPSYEEQPCNRNIVVGCYAYGGGEYSTGFAVNYGNYNQIIGGMVDFATYAITLGSHSTYNYVSLTGYNLIGTRAITIEGHYNILNGIEIYDCAENGMVISGGTYNLVTNCIINGVSSTDVGIWIQNAANYNRIIENNLLGFNTRINVQVASLGNEFHRNEFYGGAVTDGEPTTIWDSVIFPFIGGSELISADSVPWGYKIDADTEYAVATIKIPSEAANVISFRIWAVSHATEADSMRLEIIARGGSDNEPYTTESIDIADKNSATVNFAADDVIYWNITATDDVDVDDFNGNDVFMIKIKHEAAGNGDIATNATFQCVEVEYT